MISNSKDFLLFRRLLKEARPYWGHILLIFVISVLATPLALLVPLPLKVVVDSVLGDKPFPGLLEVQNCDWRLHFDEGRVEARKVNHQQEEILPKEALV